MSYFEESTPLIQRILQKFIADITLSLSQLYPIVRGSHSSIRGAVYALMQRQILQRTGFGKYTLASVYRYQYVYEISAAARTMQTTTYTTFYLKGTYIGLRPLSPEQESEFAEMVSAYFWVNDGPDKYGKLSAMINEHMQEEHRKIGGGCTGDYDTNEESERLSPGEMAEWQQNRIKYIIQLTHDMDIFYEPENTEVLKIFERARY